MEAVVTLVPLHQAVSGQTCQVRIIFEIVSIQMEEGGGLPFRLKATFFHFVFNFDHFKFRSQQHIKKQRCWWSRSGTLPADNFVKNWGSRVCPCSLVRCHLGQCRQCAKQERWWQWQRLRQQGQKVVQREETGEEGGENSQCHSAGLHCHLDSIQACFAVTFFKILRK